MALPEKRTKRPSWMSPLGHEGMGDAFFDRLWPEWRRDMGEGGDWNPDADLEERETEYVLTARIPGLDIGDISVTLEDGCVTVVGKDESEEEEEEDEYVLRDIRRGKFHLAFTLPGKVDEGGVDATYEDGVLKVVIPKRGDETGNRTIH